MYKYYTFQLKITSPVHHLQIRKFLLDSGILSTQLWPIRVIPQAPGLNSALPPAIRVPVSIRTTSSEEDQAGHPAEEEEAAGCQPAAEAVRCCYRSAAAGAVPLGRPGRRPLVCWAAACGPRPGARCLPGVVVAVPGCCRWVAVAEGPEGRARRSGRSSSPLSSGEEEAAAAEAEELVPPCWAVAAPGRLVRGFRPDLDAGPRGRRRPSRS